MILLNRAYIPVLLENNDLFSMVISITHSLQVLNDIEIFLIYINLGNRVSLS
ncbi:MAG: hypothetical protein OCC49_09610 [Fibrobacterales bacterium]